MNHASVRTENVWKTFRQAAEEIHAVRDVSLVGRPGASSPPSPDPRVSGKTTLLNLIGGLTRPTRGRILVAGEEVSAMPQQKLARFRLHHVGFVFQAYNLLPVLSAMENAEFPMLLQGVETEQRQARIRTLFERTGLAGLEDRRPGRLSGGQQQRVAVVRAVASAPALVLADEPTANLDSAASDSLLDLMSELNRGTGCDLRVRHPRYEGDGAVAPPRADGGRRDRIRHFPVVRTNAQISCVCRARGRLACGISARRSRRLHRIRPVGSGGAPE